MIATAMKQCTHVVHFLVSANAFEMAEKNDQTHTAKCIASLQMGENNLIAE